jgi:hypothetical protein
MKYILPKVFYSTQQPTFTTNKLLGGIKSTENSLFLEYKEIYKKK